MNYILMIMNQSILTILRAFSNLQKKIMNPRNQPPKLPQLKFLPKFLAEGKYLMENLIFVRRKYL